MVVFIGNLPKNAAEKELCQLARLSAGIALRIVKRKGRDGRIYRFALVPAADQRHVRRLINRLHGYEWLGHILMVHEYQHRTAANERRRVDWRVQDWSGAERRCRERRSFYTAVAPVSRVA